MLVSLLQLTATQYCSRTNKLKITPSKTTPSPPPRQAEPLLPTPTQIKTPKNGTNQPTIRTPCPDKARHKEDQDRLLECPHPTQLGEHRPPRQQKPKPNENQHLGHTLTRAHPPPTTNHATTAPPRRTGLIDRELYRLRVTIACLSETRFRGKTEINEAHYTFYLSGVPDTDNNGQPNPRVEGTGVCNP